MAAPVPDRCKRPGSAGWCAMRDSNVRQGWPWVLAMYRHQGRRGVASSRPWPSARDGRHRHSATSGMPCCDAEAGDGRSCTATTAPVPASARCLKRLRHCSDACDGCSGRPPGCGGGGHERPEDEHDRSRMRDHDSCRRHRLRRMGHCWQARCCRGASAETGAPTGCRAGLRREAVQVLGSLAGRRTRRQGLSEAIGDPGARGVEDPCEPSGDAFGCHPAVGAANGDGRRTARHSRR